MNKEMLLIPAISPELERKIMANIERRPDGIWPWVPKRGEATQYPRVSIGQNQYQLNRLMWVINQRKHDPRYQIPDGLFVCHRNDVTDRLFDCNPKNMFLGTSADNAHDRDLKQRNNAASGDEHHARRRPEMMKRGQDHWTHLKPAKIARGENHGRVKLTDSQAREIKRRRLAGELLAALATEFKCSQAQVCRIALGRKRKEITL